LTVPRYDFDAGEIDGKCATFPPYVQVFLDGQNVSDRAWRVLDTDKGEAVELAQVMRKGIACEVRRTVRGRFTVIFQGKAPERIG
jgi:hypothetical protein